MDRSGKTEKRPSTKTHKQFSPVSPETVPSFFLGLGFPLPWPGDSQRESGRFARIDSRKLSRRKKKTYLACGRFARIASNLRFAIFEPGAPRSAIRKKGVRFGNPRTIRENLAIRANLRIDSRKWGHLSLRFPLPRVPAKGVVLCERPCFCLLSAFYKSCLLRTLLRTLSLLKTLTRRLLRTLLRSTSF